ncbi:MAG: prolyl oligopeptidase family serine peptidase, partial [Planctomycetota bacterium]|nr:prolyl oligopeptidase family serine peptidase [Planctomycetota bacterium]
MRFPSLHFLIIFLLPTVAFAQGSTDLLTARKGHKTKLTKKSKGDKALPEPKGPFKLVKFPGTLGKMSAYLSQPKKAKQKYPAMIWITGGFPSGGIGSSAWERTRRDNDQSAKSYRYAGMIMMYPTFRGDAGNPGSQEGFYGEVDDVLSAAKYLAKQDFVDPSQIYLGGHSTGGTLALLAATSGYKFKAVISFGPVDDVTGYGSDALPFDIDNEKEARLRAPIRYLNAIKCPTIVIEGNDGGNSAALQTMEKANKNSLVQFVVVKGAGHFNILAPINDFLAKKIAK